MIFYDFCKLLPKNISFFAFISMNVIDCVNATRLAFYFPFQQA